MKKLIIIAAIAAVASGCATKSRTFDAKGMYVSESGQLAIGYIHVDAIPEGVESAVVHYEEDVALLSPSTKTHDIDIILTGTNSVSSSEGVIRAICDAFIQVAPALANSGGSSCETSPIDLARSNATLKAAAKAAAKEAAEACADCAKSACSGGACSE